MSRTRKRDSNFRDLEKSVWKFRDFEEYVDMYIYGLVFETPQKTFESEPERAIKIFGIPQTKLLEISEFQKKNWKFANMIKKFREPEREISVLQIVKFYTT